VQLPGLESERAVFLGARGLVGHAVPHFLDVSRRPGSGG
jgi:hypothetical protein